MDYKRFLDKAEDLVLPYVGGDSVCAPPGRRLTLYARPAHGWWRFTVRGRGAAAIESAEPPDLSKLPALRGHLHVHRLVLGTGVAEPIALLPADQPPRFSPCLARRWCSGELLFDRLELEGDGEEVARRAFQEGSSLAGVRGVASSLRAAFGLAVAQAVAQTRGVTISPLEIRAHLLEISEGGAAAADLVLDRIAHDRLRFHEDPEIRRRRLRALGEPPVASFATRVEQALRAAGARPLDLRTLQGDLAEVTFRFEHERFITVIHAPTLHVVDAGICLDGADGAITLDSLPGVIREAIAEGRLVITRHE